jgi:hypothetical protein
MGLSTSSKSKKEIEDIEKHNRMWLHFDEFIKNNCNIDPDVHSPALEVMSAFWVCVLCGENMGWCSDSEDYVFRAFVHMCKKSNIPIEKSGFSSIRNPYAFRYFRGISIKKYPPRRELPISDRKSLCF